MLDLKVPWPISAISGTYNRAHNILKLQTSYQMFLSQQMKRNMIFTNTNGKYELTDELPSDVNLRKPQNFTELLSSIQTSSQNENIVNASKKSLKTRHWTFLLLHCKSNLVSIRNATINCNGLKRSIHYRRF